MSTYTVDVARMEATYVDVNISSQTSGKRLSGCSALFHKATFASLRDLRAQFMGYRIVWCATPSEFVLPGFAAREVNGCVGKGCRRAARGLRRLRILVQQDLALFVLSEPWASANEFDIDRACVIRVWTSHFLDWLARV